MKIEQKKLTELNLKEAPLFLHVYEKVIASLKSENKFLEKREQELLFRKEQLENTFQDLVQAIINSSVEKDQKQKLIGIVEKAIIIKS